MNVGRYTKLRFITSTNAANIYDACGKKQSNRIFILKQYTRPDIAAVAADNEIRITQTIAEYAHRSIVVPVFENVKDKNGNVFLVMERKKAGYFLAELTDKGPLSLRFVLACTAEVLKSLAVLHGFAGSDVRIGYLHLDLHPGNIFLENADDSIAMPGNAKFIDFATAIKIVNGFSEGHRLAATSPFSAPELFSPGNTTCGVTADLYSVAAIFYSMYLGENLLDSVGTGSTNIYGMRSRRPDIDTARRAAGTVKQYCENQSIPDSVSRAVSAFIECALDYNPAYRYRCAEDMLAAVKRIENLLAACEKMEYETIFKMEYECFTHITDVHPETLVFSGEAFAEAVESLNDRLHVSQIDVPFTSYLFKLYWQMAKQHWDEVSGKTLFALISCGIAVSNHTGDVGLGEEVRKVLDEVKGRMDIMSYLDLNNKLAVAVADRYEFADAEHMMEKNVRALRNIKAGYEIAGSEFGMVSEDNVRSVFLARSLSSLAVNRGISCPGVPKEEIYVLFEEAIREFGGGGNVKITLCHKMHYAMMMNDQEAFEEACTRYFDVEDGCLRFVSLIDRCAQKEGKDLSDRFGLYVLVKALYTFYLDVVKAACADQNGEDGDLCAARSVGQSDGAVSAFGAGHIGVLVGSNILELLRDIGDKKLPRSDAYDPYQTIFRYLALIEYAVTREIDGRAEEYFELSIRCVKKAQIDVSSPLNIYMLIAYQTLAIYYRLVGEDERIGELTEMLYSHAEKSGWSSLARALENKVSLEEVLVHEYA